MHKILRKNEKHNKINIIHTILLNIIDSQTLNQILVVVYSFRLIE